MTRRTFLRLTLFFGSLGVISTVPFIIRSRERIIKRLVTRHIPYLAVTDEMVKQFLSDTQSSPRTDKTLSRYFLVARVPFLVVLARLLPGRFGDGFRSVEERLCQIILLSTNVVHRKEDEELRYVQLYDPYTRSCYNPFWGGGD